MVAMLYKNWLCLASASRVDQIYTLQACIPTSNIKLEPVDNGRGQSAFGVSDPQIIADCSHKGQVCNVILPLFRGRLSSNATASCMR